MSGALKDSKRLFDKNPATDSYTKCVCGHSKLDHPYEGILFILGFEGSKCKECNCDKYKWDKSIKYYWENGNTYEVKTQ